MTKEQYEIIEQYMLLHTDNNAHDSLHIYRVLNQALLIAKTEKNVNYDILVTSCLLHDIARNIQLRNPNICHATEGGKMAYEFLVKNGYDLTFCEQVKECITTHRFRSNNQPKSIEAKILFDADKLDVIGAMGIARTLTYKKNLNEPLYNLDSNGKIDYGLNLEGKESFLKEYNFKLKKIYDKFYTKEGIRISKEKKQITEIFYQDFINQIDTKELNNFLNNQK